MAGRSIAPVLSKLLADHQTGVWIGPGIHAARRELRALKAVFRRAEEMAALTRAYVDKGEQVCLTEVHLMLAVEKTRARLSGASRSGVSRGPSTVQPGSKPGRNSGGASRSKGRRTR